MTILAVDEVMLREPRLLVPGMQPLGPVKVDWNNPLTDNLVDFVVCGNAGLYSAVTGAVGIVGATPGTIQRTAVGSGYNTATTFTTTNNCLVQTPRTTLTNITLFAHCMTASSTPNGGSSGGNLDYSMSFIQYLPQGSYAYGAGIGCAASATVHCVGKFSTARDMSLGGISIGVPFVVFLWFDRAAGLWKGQLNDEAVVADDATTTFSEAAATNPYLKTGSAISTSAPGNKTLFAGGVYNKVLSDAERQAIVNDFYQFLISA